MIKQSAWGTGAEVVVSKIIWSEDLQFVDRLRCRKVCKTWETLLQDRPSSLERGGSSHELCISFNKPVDKQQHTALQLDE